MKVSEQPTLKGVTIIGFADDAALIVISQNRVVEVSYKPGLRGNLTTWMSAHGLRLATKEIEAIMFTKNRASHHQQSHH